MTTDTRNILVVVSADNCGACKFYEEKKIFESIKKQIESDGHVRYEHIKVKTVGEAVDSKYPQAINKWIRWYPTFILINGKDWNNKFENFDEKSPNVEIFNARIIDGVISSLGNQTLQQGPDKIPEWIKNNIDNNPKFKVTIITTKTPMLNSKNISIDTGKANYLPTCGAVKLVASSKR